MQGQKNVQVSNVNVSCRGGHSNRGAALEGPDQCTCNGPAGPGRSPHQPGLGQSNRPPRHQSICELDVSFTFLETPWEALIISYQRYIAWGWKSSPWDPKLIVHMDDIHQSLYLSQFVVLPVQGNTDEAPKCGNSLIQWKNCSCSGMQPKWTVRVHKCMMQQKRWRRPWLLWAWHVMEARTVCQWLHLLGLRYNFHLHLAANPLFRSLLLLYLDLEHVSLQANLMIESTPSMTCKLQWCAVKAAGIPRH